MQLCLKFLVFLLHISLASWQKLVFRRDRKELREQAWRGHSKYTGQYGRRHEDSYEEEEEMKGVWRQVLFVEERGQGECEWNSGQRYRAWNRVIAQYTGWALRA